MKYGIRQRGHRQNVTAMPTTTTPAIHGQTIQRENEASIVNGAQPMRANIQRTIRIR